MARYAPNNPDCVKKCLNDGAKAVFISEQARALFVVKDHPAVKEDVGHRLEITGIVDEEAKTISVLSVKRLSEAPAMCAVPRLLPPDTLGVGSWFFGG